MPFPARSVPTRVDMQEVFGDNTQNILQKASVSNMLGALQQLNKISIFASEIFSDILDTTQKHQTRIATLKKRIHTVEAKVPQTEDLFINNCPTYFYDYPYTEKEWQRRDPLRGLLFRRDRSDKCVNRRRDVALPLPDLSKLDHISTRGLCVKLYSDSNFFMNEWLEAEKKKMEEMKEKRRQKKKRKKKKRQGAQKIAGIEKWVYDPITGKKIKKIATEVEVKQYELTDTNTNVNAAEFKSSDGGGGHKSVYSQVANGVGGGKRASAVPKNLTGHVTAPSYARNAPASPVSPAVKSKGKKGKSPPPNPGENAGGPPPNPMMGGGPPPNPVMAAGGPPPVPQANYVDEEEAEDMDMGGGPPPNPMAMMGGPPPVPVVAVREKKKLTGAEMAAMSAQSAAASGAYDRPAAVPVPQAQKPPPMPAVASSALLAGIQKGVQLKKATQVKREPKMDARDMLLSALKNKGQTGLKKVAADQINVKKEEVTDNSSIFAILNRRQYVADDDSSEEGSEWSDSDE